MQIVGTEGLSPDQLRFELEQGGKFVLYEYCVSILVMSFRRSSNIYYVRTGEREWGRALGFSAISLLAGWWGIPWGPIWTISTVVSNLRGGKDVTLAVLGQGSEDEP